MATYHCSIKSGSKGKGASGTAKAQYICRAGKYQSKGEDLEYSESGNMPKWAHGDFSTFWRFADEHERDNGRIYTEIEIALPREIPTAERIELVREFVAEQLEHHPYLVAIHNPVAALDYDEQPHAHIIFSERTLDGIERGPEQFFKRANKKNPEKGGAAKDRSWNEREKVQQVREAWERHYNAHSPVLVSCKSLADQGIQRAPEPHLGPKLVRMGTEATKAVVANRLCQVERAIEDEREQKQQVQEGIASARAHFEFRKLIEVGMQNAREAFQEKVEQLEAQVEKQRVREAILKQQKQKREPELGLGGGGMEL